MDNFRNDEESKKKLIKKQRAAFLVSLITLLSISFCASYFITDYITNPNRKNANIDEENENVYADNKYLSDNIFITLKTQDNVDTIDKLANIIKKFNLKEKITEEELSNELSKKGYALSEKNEQKLTYIREKEVNSSKFEANKYYLGEEDGYISIFKTDADGNIIESEKKVYKDSKPITNLPETDQNYIKENKFSFDSKDDALQKLSEMIS
ncbi:hypothetical protein [Clostridium nigeriense]|uniref:hypothetical protein n=1 Tax=Clostridium nigeriense TaxID=1805470 RepID=UPI000835A820|nr:hypothetical protein [Clostridium nigeriense]